MVWWSVFALVRADTNCSPAYSWQMTTVNHATCSRLVPPRVPVTNWWLSITKARARVYPAKSSWQVPRRMWYNRRGRVTNREQAKIGEPALVNPGNFPPLARVNGLVGAGWRCTCLKVDVSRKRQGLRLGGIPR